MSQLVTIIIPCYNQAQFLEETLLSVFNQNYNSWECLLVDDGSTDNTASIAKKWLDKDQRFKYFFKENAGLSNARNYGLTNAVGDIIQFLDADDVLNSDKLELQVPDLINNDISICDYFPFNNTDGEFVSQRYLPPHFNPEHYVNELIEDWEYRKSFPPHCVLFRKSLIDKNGLGFIEDLPNHEDWVFWVMLTFKSNQIFQRKEKLVGYRIHPSSMSHDYVKMKDGFIQATKVLETYFRENDQDVLARKTRDKRVEVINKGKENIPLKIIMRNYRRLRNVVLGLSK